MKELLSLFEASLQQLHLPEEPANLYDPIRFTLESTGKRVRPNLVLLACGMVGGSPQEAIPAGMAIEILHNFTLVHDDIMDKADVRRGKPSVYKKWSPDVAILSGDVMFGLAYEQLSYYGHSELYEKAHYVLLHDVFQWAVRTVCEGQMRDMDFEKEETISLPEYELMIVQKTGALLSASLSMGGIVGNATEEEIENFHELGRVIGLAFQIQDDYLDAFGDAEKVGKRKAGDIREGKKTYLAISALENANQEQFSRLTELFQSKNVDDLGVEEVLRIFRALDVDKRTVETFTSYYQHAEEVLGSFADSAYKEALKAFIIGLKQRVH